MILGIELPVEFQQMFVDGSLNEQEFETAVNYDTENELYDGESEDDDDIMVIDVMLNLC